MANPALDLSRPQETPQQKIIDHAADLLTGMCVFFRMFVQVQGEQNLSKLPELRRMATAFEEAIGCLEASPEEI